MNTATAGGTMLTNAASGHCDVITIFADSGQASCHLLSPPLRLDILGAFTTGLRRLNIEPMPPLYSPLGTGV